jgi:hypothetical protein
VHFYSLSHNSFAGFAYLSRRALFVDDHPRSFHQIIRLTIFREILFCAFLTTLTLLPLSPLFQHFPFRDSGVFLYAGWRIREGEVPYADVWDHKPPLIYFINAAGLALGNGSVWGIWVLEWISLFAACWLAYRLFKKNFDPWASGVSLLLMLGVFSILILGGNFSTEYALPLQFACLYLASVMREEKPALDRMVFIGIFCGCLFFLKQTLIGIPVIIAFFRGLLLWRKNRKKTVVREIGGFLFGNGLIALPFLGYFAAQNALGAFWDAAFRYNLYYAETGLLTILKSMLHGLEALSPTGFGIFGIIGWTLGLWLVVKDDEVFRKQGAWLKIAFVILPAELLLAALSGRFEIHYYLSVLPVFAVFTAFALWNIFRQWRLQEASLKARIIITGIFTGALFLTSATPIVTTIGSYRTNDWSDVSEFIRSNSTSADRVLFWGAEAGLNFTTRRQSPSKYVYQYPLYRQGYVYPEDISKFIEDLQSTPPLWIIDTKNPMTPFLEIHADESGNASLQEWFTNNYSKAEEIHGWTFYRRIEPMEKSLWNLEQPRLGLDIVSRRFLPKVGGIRIFQYL